MIYNSIEEIKAAFNSLRESKTEEELIKEDEYILMANYLSEIERIKSTLSFTRKDLAKKINTSPSYLTQVFRGDKPLNFYTLAKIQRALKIKFSVKILFKNEYSVSINMPISNEDDLPKAKPGISLDNKLSAVTGNYQLKLVS